MVRFRLVDNLKMLVYYREGNSGLLGTNSEIGHTDSKKNVSTGTASRMSRRMWLASRLAACARRSSSIWRKRSVQTAQYARATPGAALLVTVKAFTGLANSDSLVVNRRDLELFRVDVVGEGRHFLKRAGRIGSVEQIMPTLCSKTLSAY